jgi:hypothetical protein
MPRFRQLDIYQIDNLPLTKLENSIVVDCYDWDETINPGDYYAFYLWGDLNFYLCCENDKNRPNDWKCCFKLMNPINDVIKNQVKCNIKGYGEIICMVKGCTSNENYYGIYENANIICSSCVKTITEKGV